MMRTEQDSAEQAHTAIQEMLPWYVNQTLAAGEQARVGAHLRGCEQCRRDVEFQRALADGAPPAPAGMDMERALARLMPRLDARSVPVQPQRAGGRNWPWRGWVPWALAAQGCAIAVLAVLLLGPGERGEDYKVLGAERQAGGGLVVAFHPHASLADLQRLAQANGARVVDGPTVTGAFVLEVEAARQAQVAAAFKADPSVMLAEPLARGEGQ